MTATLRLDALRELVDGGGVVVLSRGRAVDRVGDPGLPRPDRRVAPPRADDLPGVRHRTRAPGTAYWARSYLGWRQIAGARPNDGHRAVAALQAPGRVAGIITQNVDGLHQAAGALDVIELHGGLDRVVLPGLRRRASRASRSTSGCARPTRASRRGRAGQPGRRRRPRRRGARRLPHGRLPRLRRRTWSSRTSCSSARTCRGSGSQRCFDLVEAARAAGARLVVDGHERVPVRATCGASAASPVAIVNQGTTRGDEHATVRIDGPLGEVLPVLV